MISKDQRVPDGLGKAIGKVIEYHMEKSGVTPTELADLTGIGRTMIHNLLDGRSNNPSIFNILLIAKKLKAPLSDFMKDLDKTTEELFNSIDED